MHIEILSKEQAELLPLVAVFYREFVLVGGTAIALHIGHRKSIDFDLFKQGALKRKRILSKIDELSYKYNVTRSVTEQLNIDVNNVKFTFFEYPFEINKTCSLEKIIKFPDLLCLAAMKAYALGRRSKWKDYVDLYFMLRDYFSIKQISERAIEIYGDLFSEKLFRSQLSYFADVDYSEEVEFVKGFEVSKEIIKTFLTEKTIEEFY
jgi:hypothetical protein